MSGGGGGGALGIFRIVIFKYYRIGFFSQPPPPAGHCMERDIMDSDIWNAIQEIYQDQSRRVDLKESR